MKEENKIRSNRIFHIKQRMLIVHIIIKNMSKDLEGMRIEKYDDEHYLVNSIASIYINDSLGMIDITIKDSDALEIDEGDLYEEYYEEFSIRKWWITKTWNEKFVRLILNKEDVEEILVKLTEIYNEYEHNRLTSIMNKLNIDIDDINYLKEYFTR